MTIETKYNIGDEVWASNVFLEPIKVEVYGIFIEVEGNNTLIDYHVGFDKNECSLRKEELLFTTKEELLKSL